MSTEHNAHQQEGGDTFITNDQPKTAEPLNEEQQKEYDYEQWKKQEEEKLRQEEEERVRKR